MLCFSKNFFFQIFNWSNLLLDRSKLWLKFWFEFAWLDRCSIAAGSIECNFWSIESIFWSIENCSESFLKHKIFTCYSLFQKFQKAIRSLSSTDPDSKTNFLLFSLNLSQRFLSSSTGKTILSFLFWFNLIFHAFKGKILNLWDFGVFGIFNDFFQNWSMGFYCWMILTWSSWFNLINLINWEKLEFLGFETTQIGDFDQLSLNWWNWLVLLIHFVIIYCYLTCVMINWSVFGIFESRFSKFGVFVINFMFKPILCF